jgi:hypothetical protein
VATGLPFIKTWAFNEVTTPAGGAGGVKFVNDNFPTATGNPGIML